MQIILMINDLNPIIKIHVEVRDIEGCTIYK